MSPSKMQERDVTKGAINGPHSSTLRINTNPHTIQKSSSHASSPKHQAPTPAKRQPVIIYTHSPKVIHTHARDFMALVQKLTGYTPSKEDDRKTSKSDPKKEKVEEISHDIVCKKEYEDNHELPSALIKEENHHFPAASPSYGIDATPYMPAAADVPPLFTSDVPHLFQSPGFGNVISPPSFMDYMKGFGEYY